MKEQWWKEGIVYQIYPRSFNDSNGDGIGDIRGIIEKVDYISDLGVDIVWLNPVYESPNDDNGYDISDYKSIMDEFGTMEDWEELLEKFHENGIKLIMDLVVNHTSDEHKWFVESKKSKDNPYRDYYIWRDPEYDEDGNRVEPNNWVSFFSGPAWKYDESTDQYYLHLFSEKQPDLNWENSEVRNEVYDMMKWWLDKGIDGFRMDVINLISKVKGLPSVETKPGQEYGFGGKYFANGPRVHEFLKEMNKKALSDYDIMTVGETPLATPEEGIKYTGEDRDELNMIFQFEHMGLDEGPDSRWFGSEFELPELKKIIGKWQTELYGKGWNSNYLMNHDQPRAVSRFGDDKEYRKESAKMLATFTLSLSGTPYIYQGEEIGMTNVNFESIEELRDIEAINFYNDHLKKGMNPGKLMDELNRQCRDHSRTPVQWNSAKNSGFTDGEPWIKVNSNYKSINVEEAKKDGNSILNYYKELIKVRKNNLGLVYGNYEVMDLENLDIYAYTREYESEKYLVVLNFSGKKVDFNVNEKVDMEKAELLIGNYGGKKGGQTLSMKEYE
ncbi:MAG: glycoside hydrolase family 13 protein, partial [Fusobacteriota bacterium]